MNEDLTVTVNANEAARRLGVSKELIYKEINEGRLPAIRRGRRLTLIRVEDLWSWAEAQVKFGRGS